MVVKTKKNNIMTLVFMNKIFYVTFYYTNVMAVGKLSCIIRKVDFCLCENKGADQLRSKLISAFVFATRIIQFLVFLNQKFQASSLLL